jgi:acyl carrier protein
MKISLERLRELVADVIDTDPANIALDSDRDMVPGWDSLGHLRVITALESLFDIRLTMSQIVEARSIQQLFRVANVA